MGSIASWASSEGKGRVDLRDGSGTAARRMLRLMSSTTSARSGRIGSDGFAIGFFFSALLAMCGWSNIRNCAAYGTETELLFGGAGTAYESSVLGKGASWGA